MDLHRIVVYVLDFERYGIDDFKIAIENAVDWVSFGDSKTAEIGEWDDDHDMNTGKREAESYFMDPNKQPADIAEALAIANDWNFRRQARIEELEAEVSNLWREAANLIRQTTPRPSVIDSYERGKYDGRMYAIEQLEGMGNKTEADRDRIKARLDWLILKCHWTSEQMHLGAYAAIDEAMRKEGKDG